VARNSQELGVSLPYKVDVASMQIYPIVLFSAPGGRLFIGFALGSSFGGVSWRMFWGVFQCVWGTPQGCLPKVTLTGEAVPGKLVSVHHKVCKTTCELC